MNDMLVKNTEIESENAQEPKNYELRPLVAADMGPICKIITAIGVRQFKECFNIDQLKKKKGEDGENAEESTESLDVETIGFGVFFDIAGIIISNIPKAESEIQAFLASLTGMPIAAIKKIPFADYGELIIDVVTKKEFQDFFKRVMKLFNR